MPNETAPGIRKQFLHLSLYRCENCEGPIVAASTGVRESEIAKETGIKLLAAACLCCGNRQPTEPEIIRRFPPVQWETSESVATLCVALGSDDDGPHHIAGLAPTVS